MSQRWQRGKAKTSWGGEVRNRNTNSRKRPPGLRGKEIGLYYRDLQSNKNKKNKKETVVTLRIPKSVITQVVQNLEAIESLAEQGNIPIKKVESFILEPEPKDTPESTEKNDENDNLEQGASTSTSEQSDVFKAPIKQEAAASLDYIPLKSENGVATSSKESEVIKVPVKPESETGLEPIKSEEAVLDIDMTQEPSPSTSEQSEKFQVLVKLKPENRLDCKPIKSVEHEHDTDLTQKASTSTSEQSEVFKVPVKPKPGPCLDYIPIGSDESKPLGSPIRQLSLRAEEFKYGYNDILTGTFEDKLNESLSKGGLITTKKEEYNNLSLALHEEYKDMVRRSGYKAMMNFRSRLPTYKKAADLLNVFENNQVVVISGETGCGKSTQVPQLILDDAIRNNKGAYMRILITQPRRIAASSLAVRVAQERAESLGNSVGYAVRLEKTESRPRGSMMYCTTGILLAELEVNQGLTNYSHIILDEAHERDCHMDFSMCVLKQVLPKRKDLKVILMSATIDSDRLSAYFNDCPVVHIEGLAYPVKPVYLEEVLHLTRYQLSLEKNVAFGLRGHQKGKQKRIKEAQMEKDVRYRAEIAPWLESVKKTLSKEVYMTLQDSRIEDINIDLIRDLLVYICQGPPGAILVFLPGIGEISKLMREMEQCGAFPPFAFAIFPLHSKLATLDQRRIFDRPPAHIRKIIIATNIAETSITIDDIVYVVDCGKVKITGLNVEDNISTLKTEFESKANLLQRRGRAGRCQPGVAYHLLTTYRAETIADRLLPELQRSNLLEPVLMIKKLRLGKAAAALQLVPDLPAEITIEKAVDHLQKCGALDSEERLTPLGWHLARLPVHPAAGKLLLFGALFGCIERAACQAAVWGFKDPFNLVIGKEKEADEAKSNFARGEPSDHVAITEAIMQWERTGRHQQNQFAYYNFLSNNTLQLLSDMKQQLCDTLGQMGFLTSRNVKSSWENRNGDNLSVFKAIVAAALYPNIALVKWNKTRNRRKQQRIRVETPEDGRVELHPSSVMKPAQGPPRPLCMNPGANWLAYWLKQKSTNLYLFEVTLVYTLPLLFFGELHVSKVEDIPEDCYISVSTVKVQCRRETAHVLFRLRALLDQVLASMVKDSSERSTRHSQFDELVLKAVMDLITAEDERVEDDYFSDTESEHSDRGDEYSSNRGSFN